MTTNFSKSGQHFKSQGIKCKRDIFFVDFEIASNRLEYQSHSYEIAMNVGYKASKINEIRNVISGFSYGKPFSALRPKLECSTS